MIPYKFNDRRYLVTCDGHVFEMCYISVAKMDKFFNDDNLKDMIAYPQFYDETDRVWPKLRSDCFVVRPI